jgi:ferritin-like metal-binding protein YciE
LNLLNHSPEEKMKPLEKSFWEEAGELVHLEGMLSKALLRMHSVAHAEPLQRLLAGYRVTVEKNLAQLSQTFRLFEVPLREKKNETAMALLQKVQQIILRTGSGAVLDALILALCQKTIALKTQSYATIASWAQALSAERRDLTSALNKLLQTEKKAESDFQRLAPACDAAAAAEKLETARKREHSPAKQPKEPFRAPGDW